MDRCTGHCCREFPVPVTLEEIRAAPSRFQDGAVIADMLIPLDRPPEKGFSWYTCRHYDKSSGNCQIYDHRPRMCVEYPYGVPCEQPDCTWDSAVTVTQAQLQKKAADCISDHEARHTKGSQ